MTDWTWLYQICVKNKFRFIPGADGQPWVDLETISFLTGIDKAEVGRRCSGLRRHLSFPGLVKMTDLESHNGKKKRGSLIPSGKGGDT